MFRRLCLWLHLSGAFLAVPVALYAVAAVMDGACCYASGAAFLPVGGAVSGWISYIYFFRMSRAARLKRFPGVFVRRRNNCRGDSFRRLYGMKKAASV